MTRVRTVLPIPAVIAAAVLAVAAPAGAADHPAGVTPQEPAWQYVVKMTRIEPPLFRVSATVKVDGDRLAMDASRPGDLPEILQKGWPALVAGLKVTDAAGRPVEAAFTGESAWSLARRFTETLRLEYDVDFSLLATNGWPAPREAACVEPGTIAFVGRALFITGAPGAGTAAFDLPAGWTAVGPFAASGGGDSRFDIASADDLTANLIVLTRGKPATIRAAGFSLVVVPMGGWRPLDAEIREVLRAHLRRFVDLMDFKDRDHYLVVLLPILDGGGEAYRQSFALSLAETPSIANRPYWGNLIGHEVFHYWNGWRLRGREYAPSQWFQEGVTEYVANVSLSASGLAPGGWFTARLSEHVARARRLETPPAGIGTRKGPPLYSAGALVAFSWDVMIRRSTNGARNLGDFLRALWHRCDMGQRPYDQADILAALRDTATGDWEAFMSAHVDGKAPLPTRDVLASAGLRLDEAPDGTPRVTEDPAAPEAARRLGRDIHRGR